MAGYYDRDRQNDAIKSAGTMNHAYSHVGNTSEYMASGYPFICNIKVDGNTTIKDESNAAQTIADGDIISIAFPYVTRWVMIKAYKGSADVANAVGFMSLSETGVGTNGVNNEGPCQADLSMLNGVRLEMKCAKLFFRCADSSEISFIQVVAGLTNIPAADFVVETADNSNIGVDKTATVIMELNA